MNSEDLLWEWLRMGWKFRQMSSRPKVEQDWCLERIHYEVGLIIKKDFQDVFLVVSDAIRFAKDHGIAVGPGRGSVAASVVAWLLRIHEVYPYAHPGLLFERFLDTSRADPPDIDTDFEDDRRHEVREYLEAKYGAECVGQVGNFTRYRAKNSLLDVARVYRLPFDAKDVVANLIVERSGGDSRFDNSLEDTVNMFPAAKAVFEEHPQFWQACRLEGNYRGMGVHAAGLVLANTPLSDFCATYERDGVKVISLDKYDVEYVDAIKLDFLGLTTMSIISRVLAMTGLTLMDLYALPLDDEPTLEAFRAGDVTGVFQFEGRATRLVLRDVSPRDFTELSDVNALSRPGPLFSGTTATYVDVRHGRKRAEKLHPIVDAITARTKGQIIYQEQILQILKDIGGFDWLSVGQIRRIISKKLGEAAFQMSVDKFIQGARELHGIDEKLADKIWKLMVTSGTYSFVTAHSVCYTMIGYWCQWLKQHYPAEYLAACLSKTSDKDQAYRLMKDAQKHGIDVLPPSLEHSGASWKAIPDLGLVAGWEQIHGIGEKTAGRIEELRETAGRPFRSFIDLSAVPGIGPKTCETMETFCSAHDPFGLERTDRLMDKALDFLDDQRAVPRPTHDGEQVAAIPVREEYGAARRKNYGKGPRVIYAGIVKERNYQDAVENRRSRTGEEAEDILASLSHPELLAYCSLRCFDKTDEEVYLRVNRFKFPKLKAKIDSIAVNHDVVVCVGNRIAGFGTPVMVEDLWVIDPD
jgi:DNA polymerase III subunit alpha